MFVYRLPIILVIPVRRSERSHFFLSVITVRDVAGVFCLGSFRYVKRDFVNRLDILTERRRAIRRSPKYRRLYLFDVRFKFTNVHKETTVRDELIFIARQQRNSPSRV